MAPRRPWYETRVTAALDVALPIVQGPFGGGLSSTELAAAVSNAGGLGSFGANYLEPDGITQLVAELSSMTRHPFNVNLWVPLPGERDAELSADQLEASARRLAPFAAAVGLGQGHHPPRGFPDFDDQLDALLAAGPPVISFVFGVPPSSALSEARGRSIVTIGTATTVDEAVALDESGIDLIVASGSDAGGHRGAFLRDVDESLVGTMSLVPQVVDAVDKPVVAAGGIADHRQVRAAFELGAEGVQIGTAFLVTSESTASDVHKDVLTSDRARTTVLTSAFTGRVARAVPNDMTRSLKGRETELPDYPLQSALTLPIRRAAASRGNPELLNLWSGQSASLASPGSAVDYLHRLVDALGDQPADDR